MRARDENQHSTVLCSQVSVQGWHERLGSGGVADTLLDRITTNGYEYSGRFYTACPVMETVDSGMMETAIPEMQNQ